MVGPATRSAVARAPSDCGPANTRTDSADSLAGNAPSALIYLRVGDVRAASDELRASGVAIESGPHIIHTDADGVFGPAGWQEWMAFIKDSEGNLVGLASRHAPDS